MHTVRHGRGSLVLPRPYHAPSGLFEGLVDRTVSGHVPSELGLPVIGVGPRLIAVDGAGMPEAAVDEHGDPDPGERDVHPHYAPRNAKRQVLAEPQSPAVELGAQRDLRSSVPPRVAAHAGTDLSARWVRIRKWQLRGFPSSPARRARSSTRSSRCAGSPRSGLRTCRRGRGGSTACRRTPTAATGRTCTPQ